jgi:hypothetical protein
VSAKTKNLEIPIPMSDIVVTPKPPTPVRVQKTIVRVVTTQNRRATTVSTKKAAKPPVKSSKGQRVTSLPYPQRITAGALKILERRGITLQQLRTRKPSTSPSFTDVMLQGFSDHKKLAAKNAAVAASKPKTAA